MTAMAFPKGTYSLNFDPNFSFQLNRVIQWDGGRLKGLRLRDEEEHK